MTTGAAIERVDVGVGRKEGGRGWAADALERRAMHRARFKAERRLPSRRRRLLSPSLLAVARYALHPRTSNHSPRFSSPSCSAASRCASTSLSLSRPSIVFGSFLLRGFPRESASLFRYPSLVSFPFLPPPEHPCILTHFSQDTTGLDNIPYTLFSIVRISRVVESSTR